MGAFLLGLILTALLPAAKTLDVYFIDVEVRQLGVRAQAMALGTCPSSYDLVSTSISTILTLGSVKCCAT